MNFISKIFTKKGSNKLFLGDWFSDLKDERTRKEIGDVKMKFTDDGKLVYRIHEGEKDQFIFLLYQIDGNILITDQPSHPQKEETEYCFIGENVLILKYKGEETRFLKKLTS